MRPESRPEAPFALQPQAWLAYARERYRQDPDRGDPLLAELLPIFEAIPESPPPQLPVLEFAILLLNLGFERRRAGVMAPVVERALRWADAGQEPALQPMLWCFAARLRLMQQQFDAAAEFLQRASVAVEQDAEADPHAPVAIANALGLLARAQGDSERALVHARRSLVLASRFEGGLPWMQTHTHLAIVLRMLGQQEERHAVLTEGRLQAQHTRRWAEAANLTAGLVDMALERADLAAAEALLAEGDEILERGAVHPEASGRLALRGARARWLASSGHPAQACALVEPMLDAIEAGGGQRELLRSLDELQAWKVAQGDGEQALALSRRAHALRLALDREAQGQEALRLRQQIELTQAEAERREHEARAAQAEERQRELQAQLDQLLLLQAELSERRQQASMAPLLAGVAHELNTPLGTTLTSLSSAVDMGQRLLESDGAALGRKLLVARLQAMLEAQDLARRNLERALALIETYRPAQAVETASDELHRLAERAWQRALAPGHGLSLQVDDGVGASVWPSQAMEEVLVQLFQNTERHAYAPGEAGAVRVQGRWDADGALLLTVQDEGRGIAAALLPHVFEPYVTTQFGRGRSGLGLFIAQAVVRQGLGGRLRVHSPPGAGCCFEIGCAPIGGADGLRR